MMMVVGWLMMVVGSGGGGCETITDSGCGQNGSEKSSSQKSLNSLLIVLRLR